MCLNFVVHFCVQKVVYSSNYYRGYNAQNYQIYVKNSLQQSHYVTFIKYRKACGVAEPGLSFLLPSSARILNSLSL